MIDVYDLKREFKIYEKMEGLKGSIRNMFHRQYRVKTAVNNISFSIKKGEIIGFIGPNGAGKTTTLKMLSGLLHPTAGTAKVSGFEPWQRKKEFLRNISFVMGQKSQIWWDIPAIDSFILLRDIYEIPNQHFRKKLDDLSQLLHVSHLLRSPVRNLSLGERMKMELIGSLLHSPEVLFLDEPTIGLDFESQKNIRGFIAEYNRKYGATVVLTSHYMADISSLCDRVIIINKGQIIYDGMLDKIKGRFDKEKIVEARFSSPVDITKVQAMPIKLSSYQNDRMTCTVSRDVLPSILTSFSELSPYDLVIKDPPMEEIIEELYREGT